MQTDLEGDNLDQANAAQNSANLLKEARVLGQTVPIDLSALIAENFGANATYVEGLLSRFRSNPELVDESWRTYFSELLGDGEAAPASDGEGAQAAPDQPRATPPPADSGNGDRAATTTAARATAAEAASPAKAEPKPPKAAQPVAEDVEVIPIRGAALKIVENMEASLSVPTATSQRRIPVKLLDEN